MPQRREMPRTARASRKRLAGRGSRALDDCVGTVMLLRLNIFAKNLSYTDVSISRSDDLALMKGN
jgi:hypothetical protein